MMIFLLYESPKKKLNSTLIALEFRQLIPMELPNSRASNAKGNLKKVFSVYKENICAAYNVSDIEIEEISPIYGRDTKNKAEELARPHAAMKERLVTTSNTEKLQIFFRVFNSICKRTKP